MTAPHRPTFYRRWLSPEGYLGAHLTVGFVLALVAGIAFGVLARHVFGPTELSADAWARYTARGLTHPYLTRVMRAITFLGTPVALVPLSLLVIGWLLRVKSHRRLYAFTATMAGGTLLNHLLKLYFRRPRPGDMGILAVSQGYSFPSGHSMGSMMFFGSLAYVVYFTIERHRRWRLPALGLFGLAVLLIGLSRIYLGVHYLSDVVGGYAAGLCWMGVCLSGTEAWVRWRDWRRTRQRRAAGASTEAKQHRVPVGVWTGVLLGGLASSATAAAGGVAPAGPPCAACLVWEATPDQAERLLARPEPLLGLDLLVRAEAAVAPGLDPDLDLLNRLRARGVRTGVVQPLGRPASRSGPLSIVLFVLRPDDAAASPEALAFQIKAAAIEARARHPAINVGLEAPAPRLAALASHGLAAYLDFVVAGDAAAGPIAALPTWPRAAAGAGSALLLEATRQPGLEHVVAAVTDVDTTLDLLRLASALPRGLAPLDQVRVTCPDEPGPGCASEVFLDPGTLDAVALVRPAGSVRVVQTQPPATAAVLYPLGPAAVPGSTGPVPLSAAGPGRWLVPEGTRPFVLRLFGWTGTTGRFASGVEVAGERPLTVAEIVARHQAAARRQAQAVPRRIASGHSVLTFQVPGLAAPMTVTAQTVLFAEGDRVELEEQDLRLDGAALPVPADGVPRLPLVEPERVTRPPLALSLDESYRYALAGRQQAGGRSCYVVAFEPKEARGPSLRGRAWIAADDFGMVRTRAVRTGLVGPIVSSEEEDEFVPVATGSGRVWLLARTEAHQIYEGPGHRTPVHRRMTFDTQEPDPPDFEARRAAALASKAVMLRDTPDGLRYLRRTPARTASAAVPETLASDSPTRMVAERRTRVRALALGVVRDPNITVPLPFAGVSYADLDFLRRGGQVNVFAALGFLQAAWSLPAVGGTRWQLQGSAFATAAEYNDRSFRSGLERYEENLRQRPARFAAALVRPLSPRLRLRLGYELGYVRLRRSDTTAADYAVPTSPLTHGLRLAVEGERGPWSGGLWWSPALRQRWTTWGPAGAPEPARRTFHRFGLSAARSFVLGRAVVARLDASALDGRGLDRFSRYTFDAFETRLRGYPSASLRFDRGVVLRTALVGNAGRGMRLDAFADAAWVRDPGFGPALRPYPGVGAAFESPAPLHTLFSLEWGYGFEARSPRGERGTHVVRATVYRVF